MYTRAGVPVSGTVEAFEAAMAREALPPAAPAPMPSDESNYPAAPSTLPASDIPLGTLYALLTAAEEDAPETHTLLLLLLAFG